MGESRPDAFHTHTHTVSIVVHSRLAHMYLSQPPVTPLFLTIPLFVYSAFTLTPLFISNPSLPLLVDSTPLPVTCSIPLSTNSQLPLTQPNHETSHNILRPNDKEKGKGGGGGHTTNIPPTVSIPAQDSDITLLKPSLRSLSKHKIRHPDNLTPREQLLPLLSEQRVLPPPKRTPVVP